MKRLAAMLVVLMILTACKPDKIELELYTSDIQTAAGGEVVEIPCVITFGSIGDDEDGSIAKAMEAAKKYFPAESEFNLTKGENGKTLTITSVMPLGTQAALEEFLKTRKSPYAIVLRGTGLYPEGTEQLGLYNKELEDLGVSFTIEALAGSSLFKIVGDMKTAPEVSAMAVFVDGKPELTFRRKIARRESVLLDFRGGDDSVYSGIPIQMTVVF
jgi:hypothetical protein